MDKRAQRILMAFGVAVVLLVVVEVASPKPVSWLPSYTATDKVPLGGYVFFNELEGFFSGTDIDRITRDPYEQLRRKEYGKGELYIFLNDYIQLDKQQYQQISEFVADGNTALIASKFFGSVISDSLNIDTETNYDLIQKEIEPQFYKSESKIDSPPAFKKAVEATSFSSVDTTVTKTIGYFIDTYDDAVDNFIRVPYGEGNFYFLSTPEAFTNYYLLKDNHRYAQRVLSHFKPTHIYWDDYIKSGRTVVDSKIRFVLTQPSLKWAYYLAVLGLLFFVIFRFKREQRIIPVVTPLRNDTKDFTATIGDLHFQYKDYGNIIAKKITYFLERVRSELYVDTSVLDDDFTNRLSLKSGNTPELTKELVDCIKTLKNKPLHSEEDLVKLNKLLEKFSIH